MIPLNKKNDSLFLRLSIPFILFYIFFMRLFTEEFPLLPRFAQLTDKPLIIICLLFLILFLPKIMYLDLYGFGPILSLLLLSYLLSAIFNYKNQSFFPLASHFILFWGPFIWFITLIFFKTSQGYLKKIVKYFIVLLFLEVIVGIILLPEGLQTPDLLRGTFGYGYKQLVFYYLFLAVILLGWFIYNHSKQFPKWIIPITINFLAARMLIVYPAYFLSLFSTYALAKQRKNLILPAIIISSIFLIIFINWSFLIEYSSDTYQFDKLTETLTNFFQVFPKTGIIRSFVGWLNMLSDYPLKIFFGTGPATFGSRAFTNIYVASDAASNVTANLFTRPPTPAIALNYLLPARMSGLGSGTVTQPFNSYVGVIGELGIIGGTFFLLIYIKVIKDFLLICKESFSSYLKGLAIGCIGAIIFLAQMSLFYDFFAIERINLGLWLIIAIVYKLRDYEKQEAQNNKNKSTFYPKYSGSLPRTII